MERELEKILNDLKTMRKQRDTIQEGITKLEEQLQKQLRIREEIHRIREGSESVEYSKQKPN
ncbi:hypothetical protein B2K_16380 [Paenibacillus mucilaginosus K02]|uniref:Uncharacterized protein n=1 Tax=Paenibacillus mucilaginosus K02 TaxID=997761 RepID=I0BIT1_9BACL|nr:hypothetical protein B2K_16380 [Paenibacillus mucilaginosus K02]